MKGCFDLPDAGRLLLFIRSSPTLRPPVGPLAPVRLVLMWDWVRSPK